MTKSIVSIGVVTSINLKDRYTSCQSSWGKDFDHIYYFGGNNVENTNLIRVPDANEDYNSFFPKQQYALKFMYEKNPEDDWYCVVGCDHVLFKDSISSFLRKQDSSIDTIFCETYNRFEKLDGLDFEVFAGGAGFFLSNSAMKKIYPFIDQFNKEWLDMYINGKLVESCYACGDIAISYMVKKFLNLKLTHGDGMYSQSPSFYSKLIDKPLTFHYIKSYEMESIYKNFSK